MRADTIARMKVQASPQARSLIGERGGCVFVRVRRARCCSGTLTTLEATTTEPVDASSFRAVEGDGFTLFVGPVGAPEPDVIDLEVRGRRRRVRAYWNGCAYAI